MHCHSWRVHDQLYNCQCSRSVKYNYCLIHTYSRLYVVDSPKIYGNHNTFSVPAPTPSITYTSLTAGTMSTFMCNYTLNVDVRATAVWTLNEVPIPTTGNERISTDKISLIFSPLTTSDSGEYSCTLNIMSLMQYVAIIGGVTMTKIDVQSKSFVYGPSSII